MKTTKLLFAVLIFGAALVSCMKEPPPPVKVTSISLNQNSATVPPDGTLQLSVSEVLPADAEDKSVSWSSSASSTVATVSPTGLVTILPSASAGATAIITATANDGSGIKASCKITVLDGVLINGIIWATSNVDAPGTFAATPEAPGMYYKWGSKVGWSSTNPLTPSPANSGAWATVTPEIGNVWLAANNPCPTGWRLPIDDEVFFLLMESQVSRELVTSPVKGFKFTDKNNPNNSIFIPSAGWRYDSGTLVSPGGYGGYWTSSIYTSDGVLSSSLYLNGSAYTGARYRTYGLSVRCVLIQ